MSNDNRKQEKRRGDEEKERKGRASEQIEVQRYRTQYHRTRNPKTIFANKFQLCIPTPIKTVPGTSSLYKV